MDKKKAIYLAAMAFTLAASFFKWEFLVISALFAILYDLSNRSGIKKQGHETLAFAKDFKQSCLRYGFNATLLSTASNPSAPKEISELSKKAMLGQIDFEGLGACNDPNLKELLAIIMIGLQNGTDIRNNLDILIKRLESDMDDANRQAQGSLNMDTLSLFGISFFVPLFGGIGASIMGSSGAILGANSAPTLPFETIIVMYVAIMSYITGIFRSGNSLQSLFKSFQTAVIAAGIIKASAAFMSYAI